MWTLKNCLHAPDVPINLISVGALQEHHMSINFSFQKTSITFPHDHPQLKGISFDAVVLRRLSFLNLNFISQSPTDTVLAIFPAVPNTPDLWHRLGPRGYTEYAHWSICNGNKLYFHPPPVLQMHSLPYRKVTASPL